MPPRRLSRYTFTEATADLGPLRLTEREPFGYRPLADNRTHLIAESESLWTLAARYFAPFERPAGLWWVIADFQPDPILDPTRRLPVGGTLIIPSVRTVQELIFSDARRYEASP
jgi:hypothetical protein